LLEKAEQALKDQFLSRSKYNVRIKTTISPLLRNRVSINIKIDEGKNARIEEIKIYGANKFDEESLLDLFSLSTKNLMSWYTKSNQYSREKLDGDIETLRSFYLDSGYLEFNINSSQVSLSPDRTKVFISILINEGEKFTVGKIKLTGDLLGQESMLNKKILIKTNQTFSNLNLQKSIDIVTNRMGDFGYAFARAIPIPKINKNSKVVDFEIDVNSGQRAYVRRIDISGNAKTRDEVIRREMRQLESAWYDAESITLSRSRIDRLGYFQSVDMSTSQVLGTKDQVDIGIKVEERPLGSITAGVGFSSSENIVLTAGISQQNFLGSGTNVSFQINTSDISQTYAFSYTNPYWTDEGVSRTFDIYTRRFDANQVTSLGDYKTDSKGIGVRFGIPYTEFDRIYFGAKYEATDIDLGLSPPSRYNTYCIPYLPDCSTNSVILTLGWSRDTRDNGLAPNKGNLQKANIDYASPVGDVEYARITYEFQWFKPIFEGVTFATNIETGYGFSLGESEFPIFRNFYAGGIGSLRGFANRSIGEKDLTDGSSIGGTKKLVINNEILFPMPGMKNDRTIRVFGYFDAGSIWGDSQDITFEEVRASVGVGFSWFSPVGPLKISFGSPIRKKEGDDTQTVQFQLGTAF
jgi:outer membrane protein insertion porin family